MLDIVIYLIGLIITVPIVVTWIVYFIGVKMHGHKWTALHKAVNWTTLLYIIAVLVLLQQILGNSFFGIFIILLPSIFTFITIIQWKLKTEVVFRKVFKIFWRICFLMFALLYCLLVFIGIIKQIIS